MTATNEPKAGVPMMWGARGSDPDKLYPWSWALERLEKTRNYWVISVWPDGSRPHAAPVWGAWLDGVFYFSTGTSSRKALNIAARPNVVVHLEAGDEAVIVNGRVQEVSDPATLARFKAAYDPKYEWDMDVSQGGVYAVLPRDVIAFTEFECAERATKWTFA